MISGSNNLINWDILNEQVDPLYNQVNSAIDTSNSRAIAVDANHSENSMAALNRVQLDNKKRLEQRYKDNQLDPIFCNDCDSQIRQYILDGYAKNPAIYSGLELPLEYDEDLNASNEVRQAYYQNPWHTAYRYFVLTIDGHPNLWINPDAQYMGTLEYNGKYYKTPQIQDNHRALIRAMWVAVNDPEFTLSEMHTAETAKLELINVFAALGRAHNWDQTRWVTKQVKGRDGIVREQQVEEEYDNLDLDYPSCPWGLEQRLTQYVMLVLKEDANERTLNSLIIRNKFKEEMISEIDGKKTIFGEIAKMDLPSLTKLNEALLELVVINTGDFEGLDDDQKAILRQIQCYTTKDIENFLNGCKAYYGDFRLTQKLKQKVTYQDLSFNNYGQLALQFAREPWTLFYDAIAEKIKECMTALGANANNPEASVQGEIDVKDDNDIKEDNDISANVGNVAQNVEVLRQQLIEIAIRERQVGILEQLFVGDNQYIQQMALQFKAKLPQIEFKPNTVAEASSKPEVVPVSLQEEENARQAILDYAFENGDEALAERMLDAPINEVQQALEVIRQALAQLETDLAFARRLEEEADREQQAETERLAAEQREQQAAAVQQAQVFQQVAERYRMAVTPSYTPARNQTMIRSTEPVKLNAELSMLFKSEISKKLLDCLNENVTLVNNLNSWQPALIERFVKGLETNAKVETFKSMNNATKIGFIDRFQTAFKPKADVLAY